MTSTRSPSRSSSSSSFWGLYWYMALYLCWGGGQAGESSLPSGSLACSTGWVLYPYHPGWQADPSVTTHWEAHPNAHQPKPPGTVLTGSSVSEWCAGRGSLSPAGGWSPEDGTQLAQGCRGSRGVQEKEAVQGQEQGPSPHQCSPCLHTPNSASSWIVSFPPQLAGLQKHLTGSRGCAARPLERSQVPRETHSEGAQIPGHIALFLPQAARSLGPELRFQA